MIPDLRPPSQRWRASGRRAALVGGDGAAGGFGMAALTVVCAGVALAALVVASLAGGGAPVRAPAGLPDAGPATGWALAASRLLADASAVVMTGGLLVAAFLLPHPGDRLTMEGLRTVRTAGGAGACLAVTGLVQLVLTAAETRGVPPPDALDLPRFAEFAVTTTQGLTLTTQITLAATAAALARGVATGGGAFRLFPVALAATVAPIVAGHTATAGDPLHLSALTLAAHVLAAALWAGGLATLTFLALLPHRAAPAVSRHRLAPAMSRHRPAPAMCRLALVVAVGRFSGMAFVCAVTVGACGVATALMHSGSPAALAASGYGGILLVKAAALVVLAGFGREHRRRTLPRLATGGTAARHAFARLAAAELLVMAGTYGLATALAHTPPPT